MWPNTPIRAIRDTSEKQCWSNPCQQQSSPSYVYWQVPSSTVGYHMQWATLSVMSVTTPISQTAFGMVLSEFAITSL